MKIEISDKILEQVGDVYIDLLDSRGCQERCIVVEGLKFNLVREEDYCDIGVSYDGCNSVYFRVFSYSDIYSISSIEF